MPQDRIERRLQATLAEMAQSGRLKGRETVIEGVIPASGALGPRFVLAGEGDRPFLRMNSNGYLGLSLLDELIAVDDAAVRHFGTGPGAVRFISGTWSPHVSLERRIATFHGRDAAMIFSSAYATVMGVIPSLIDEETAVLSDALNHNCIINAIRLVRPKRREVYPHLDMAALGRCLEAAAADCRRAIVVTDGVFSMRGDHAPLDTIVDLARRFDSSFAENVLVVVDDSHGVGGFGSTGRGTEEVTSSGPVDLLVGTLGKAFGVNGGYLAGSAVFVEYLRETSPFYIYSNPITPGEAATAIAAIDIVDGPKGVALLAHLRAMTARFRDGLRAHGFETVAGLHPVVPLLVRDTQRTASLVRHLRTQGVLATGLGYPVVPRGEEEIRFQISADHTEADIDAALAAIASFA